jgi:hypothetical protein
VDEEGRNDEGQETVGEQVLYINGDEPIEHERCVWVWVWVCVCVMLL